MADYQYDQRRYGPPSGNQRDTAFSNIFGAHPPPGRNGTGSASPSNNMMPQSERTHTMSSMSSQGPPPDLQPRGPPRPQRGGGYEELAHRTRTMDASMANGYYQSQRNPSGGYPPRMGDPYGRQQQGPNQRPYPGPPPQGSGRYEPRGPPPQHNYPPRNPGPRHYQGGPPPGPALRDDPYRSQSLANIPRQPMYQPPPNSYQTPQQFRHPPNQVPNPHVTEPLHKVALYPNATMTGQCP
ncbi:hypothetical protein CIB48_g5690 [Xylaria polymorpha]|nr:hypothetical protein CIB48_g5690 [Xylaria polymorpha]